MNEGKVVKSKDFIIRSHSKKEIPHVVEQKEELSHSELSQAEFSYGEPFKIKQQNIIKTGIGKHAKNISFNKMTMLDEKEILCLKYDKAGSMIACGLSNGYVYIYNPNTGSIARRFECNVEGEPVTCLRFSPLQSLGLVIASSTDGSISQFRVSAGKKAEVAKQYDEFTGSVIQPLGQDYKMDGSAFAACYSNGSIAIYDDETKQKIINWKSNSISAPGHSNRVFSVKYIPELQDVIVSAGWDNNVFIWDVRERHPIDYFKAPKVSGDALDYKAGNQLIGCSDSEEPLSLWNFAERTKICGIKWTDNDEANDAFVYSCTYNRGPDDYIVAASIGRNELQIFEKDIIYKPTWTITGQRNGIYACDISPKGDTIAFGGADQHIYQIDVGKIV